MVLFCAAPLLRAADIKIDADFPGGNIIVEQIEGDVARIRPDLRDTQGSWFYWAFRVRGAQGRTIKFDFTDRPRPPLTVRGPAISVDDGIHWKWLGRDVITEKGFNHTFADGEKSVLFSMGMPYTQRNLEALLKRIGDNPSLRADTLTTSRKGRPVERLHLGRLDGQPSYRMLLSSTVGSEAWNSRDLKSRPH